jgi:peptide/nickel transport system ATP-binding protein
MTGLLVNDLHVEFFTDDGVVRAVDGVDFTVRPGLRMGVVGESGSGKTTTALALMGMIKPPGRITGGTALLDGIDLLRLGETEHARVRLRDISYIPQGAMNSLNPVMRIETQLVDGMIDHGQGGSRAELRARARSLLERVGLPTAVARMYPHELSGGMKQRVCIAIAISLRPQLIIADEPTSALDVITQRRVMQALRRVQEELGASLILIGHDMGLMAQFVDELLVMRSGKLVEQGSVQAVFKQPRHEYTRTLISSVPSLDNVGAFGSLRDTAGAPAASAVPRSGAPPLLELHGVAKTYTRGLFAQHGTEALLPLSFTLHGDKPLIVSVVGQSGSGKTTLGSLILGFIRPTRGRILYEGRDLNAIAGAELKAFRARVQAVFQDPYSAYNPFYKVDHALAVPLFNFGLVHTRDEAFVRMERACREVGLDPTQTIHRFAHQLSGGQRQRLMVGRALMLTPRLLIADEPVSMVDASLRATILSNLGVLKQRHGVSILYITHDLATAYHVSDYVLVIYKGRVVEAGETEVVIKDPRHPYTQLLVSSIPWPDPDRQWGSDETIARELHLLADSEVYSPPLLRSTIEGFSLRLDGAAA